MKLRRACIILAIPRKTRVIVASLSAIAGWPLGDAHAHSEAVMTKLLGEDINDWQNWAAQKATYLHIYGKAEANPGRKMAHVTRLRARR